MTSVTKKTASKVKTSTYDVAEHLRTPEEMAAYLDAWLDEAPDDVSGIARALGDIARAKGMSQVAKDAGLSRESLYRALILVSVQVEFINPGPSSEASQGGVTSGEPWQSGLELLSNTG